jgi:hypothetical protein
MMSLIKDQTIAVKAVPVMIPPAIAKTFLQEMNFRNALFFSHTQRSLCIVLYHVYYVIA